MASIFDVVCLSHLRWDYVWQRPQHLLMRCGRERRVYYVEEPRYAAGPARLEVSAPTEGVRVVIPHLPHALLEGGTAEALRRLLDDLFAAQEIHRYVLWYYTPMAMNFTRHLQPLVTVYDCMDELTAFAGAPRTTLREREDELFARADLVFTGGYSLYESKRSRHDRVYLFPSSVDAAYFRRARGELQDPPDQAGLPRPRLGFFGVIDERLDRALLAAVAAARPSWQYVLLGPVAKILPRDLPDLPNVHYLGAKPYEALPAYLAGWDVALLPFAHNEATRYISPTKTPEYLAAGRPVVSTPIRDVVRPYGEQRLVRIAATPEAFVRAAEQAMAQERETWLERVDAVLTQTSWDDTWARMAALIEASLPARPAAPSATAGAAPPAAAR